jgi:hypothetical protein
MALRMSNHTNNLTDLNEAINEANNTLSEFDSSPFTSKAYESLKDKISSYIGQIITESIRISKRHKADLVSQTHVEDASDNLISKKRGKLSYLAGTLGGIFLGATVSNIFGMLVLNQTFTTTGIIITIIIGIVGAFLIAINLGNE